MCLEFIVSSQCTHGDVRLVGGSVPNEGRVEVCVNFVWDTVVMISGMFKTLWWFVYNWDMDKMVTHDIRVHYDIIS